MASGKKEMVYNSLERLLSTDPNRAQKFSNADLAAIYRYMMDFPMGTDDLDASGVMTQVTTTNSPLNGEILNGLMVRPNIGTLDLLVDPGLAWLLNPDAAADDDNYKYVKDAGIASLGVLQMTANTSGQTRVDVV